MPLVTVDNADTLTKLLGAAPLALLYVGAPTCSICTVVKPKIEALCTERFPKLLLIELDRDAAPDIAAAWQVFSLPAVVLAVEGKEVQRWVRAFSIEVIADAVARPYGMVYP